jgi:hypothetical protein
LNLNFGQKVLTIFYHVFKAIISPVNDIQKVYDSYEYFSCILWH